VQPRAYARSLAVIFGVLGVLGAIPGLDTLFGLAPLYGHDVWLHLGSAAVAAYVGFALSERAADRRSRTGDRRRASRAPIANERRQGPYDRRRMPFPA
jgi:hypothetical protein